MNNFKSKLYIGSIVIILLLGNIGCAKSVESYKKFNIYGFEEFFDIKNLEDQNEYIASGKLASYERENIIFIPFIKEISDTECAILLFLYSENINNEVILNGMELITSEGSVICFNENFGEIVVSPKWNDSMTIVNTFNKSNDWFYNDNNLTLNIDVSIKCENKSVNTDLSYDVVIVGYKGTSIQA